MDYILHKMKPNVNYRIKETVYTNPELYPTEFQAQYQFADEDTLTFYKQIGKQEGTWMNLGCVTKSIEEAALFIDKHGFEIVKVSVIPPKNIEQEIIHAIK